MQSIYGAEQEVIFIFPFELAKIFYSSVLKKFSFTRLKGTTFCVDAVYGDCDSS